MAAQQAPQQAARLALLNELRELGHRLPIARNAAEVSPFDRERALALCQAPAAHQLQLCLDALADMGFPRGHAVEAVRAVGYAKPEHAANWLLTRDTQARERQRAQDAEANQMRAQHEAQLQAAAERLQRTSLIQRLEGLYQLPSSDPDVPALADLRGGKKSRSFFQAWLHVQDRRRVLIPESQRILLLGRFPGGHREYLVLHDALERLLLDLDALELPKDGDWRERRRTMIREADRIGGELGRLWKAQADAEKASKAAQAGSVSGGAR